MQIQTIRITSEPSHDNPEGFVIINLADFDGSKHEPFDEESHAAVSGAAASGEIVPTMAELLAARDQLMARERELNAERDRLDDQAAANAAEAQRLADEKAAADAAKAATDKATAKAVKPAADDKK